MEGLLTAPKRRLQDQSRNVLLIDVDALVRAVGEGMLKHLGYTVTCATNGQEGMDYLKTHADEIDLVITDLTMPVMSGKEVLREVRKRYP
ncbi:response regulator [Verrucomicrobiales bacterium]|nr:response regulator [Verrucomicrobiales bacterium]